jgi:mannosyltransferase OCH1-like enzyme
MLGGAKKLIGEGRLAEARQCLQEISQAGLGGEDAKTSLSLPRRLQSAMLKLAKAERDDVHRIAYQYHLVPAPERLEQYGIFSPQERDAMVELSRVPVPRCIHQIWLGARPVPPTAGAWADHAARNGYEYRLWREDDLVQAAYDRHPALRHMLAEGDFPGAVDVARYLILDDHGGIYLDCDWYPAHEDRSFHHVLPMVGLCVFAEGTPRNTGKGSTLFANSFIATPAGHPVFARLGAVLPAVLEDLGDAPAWWSTGPLIFTVLARSGPVVLADADFVAASMPASATLSDVEAQAKKVNASTGGLLIAWKPW